jgi:hypothetical protein
MRCWEQGKSKWGELTMNRAAQTLAHGARRITVDGEKFQMIGRVTELNTSRQRPTRANEQS